MPPEKPAPKLRFRKNVSAKLRSIKKRIDEQRGNDPDDVVSDRLLNLIFEEIDSIRYFPWQGLRINSLPTEYRQYIVGKTYRICYYVEDPETLLIIYELRHASQKPLSPSTHRKYKREAEKEFDIDF